MVPIALYSPNFEFPPLLASVLRTAYRVICFAMTDDQLERMRCEIQSVRGRERLTGSSGRARVVYNLIWRVAGLNAFVPITGESGPAGNSWPGRSIIRGTGPGVPEGSGKLTSSGDREAPPASECRRQLMRPGLSTGLFAGSGTRDDSTRKLPSRGRLCRRSMPSYRESISLKSHCSASAIPGSPHARGFQPCKQIQPIICGFKYWPVVLMRLSESSPMDDYRRSRLSGDRPHLQTGRIASSMRNSDNQHREFLNRKYGSFVMVLNRSRVPKVSFFRHVLVVYSRIPIAARFI